jgi:hypothetical protein
MKTLFVEVLHTYQRMLNDSSIPADQKKLIQTTLDKYDLAAAILDPVKAITRITDGAHVLYHHTTEVSLRPLAYNRLTSISQAEVKVVEIIANSINN